MKNGFTVIETIIAIAIVCLVVAIVIPAIVKGSSKDHESQELQKSQEAKIDPVLLFERDGVKVYRFIDRGGISWQPIYYMVSNGKAAFINHGGEKSFQSIEGVGN